MKQKSKPASKPIDTFRVIAISPEMQTEIINHATLGLNIEEIALHLNLDEELIEPYVKKGLVNRKLELLKLQWDKAPTDTNVLIHLSKTIGGQNDKTEQSHTINHEHTFDGMTREELMNDIKRLL